MKVYRLQVPLYAIVEVVGGTEDEARKEAELIATEQYGESAGHWAYVTDNLKMSRAAYQGAAPDLSEVVDESDC